MARPCSRHSVSVREPVPYYLQGWPDERATGSLLTRGVGAGVGGYGGAAAKP